MGVVKVKMSAVTLVIFMLITAIITSCQKNTVEPWSPGKPLEREAVKVGVIFVGNPEDGYSYAHDVGIKEAQQKIGLHDDQIIRKLNVTDSDAIMVEHLMIEAIAEGANIIIATSWGYMDTCEKLASKYPNIIFANASGYKYNDTNFTNYFGRIYQARYLSGVAAGLKTETNKIGFVAAMDLSNSEVTGGINAFALGAETVNPDVEIYVRVTHSWYDPAGERKATQRLISEGCDVIAQHCDTSVPQNEAQKAGVWGIGYNCDMSREAPNTVLTSVIWNWGVYYTYLINSVIDGSFTTEPYYGGLTEGVVDIFPLNEALATPEIESAVAAAKDRIFNGNHNVFDGLMKTNDNRTVGTEGGTLSDAEITGGINWYYHNIIELK